MYDTNSAPKPRPFSLGLYLLLVCGLSWPFQIIGVIWAKGVLSLYLLNSLSMVMVTAGTYIAGRYIFRDGFADAGWQWGKRRHYLAVTGLIALLWLFPTLVRLLVGVLSFGDLNTSQIVWLFVLPLVTLVPGFGEEFGWRGYMLPRLAQQLGTRKAIVLHAVIWWAWHWPVLIGGGIQAGIASAGSANMPVGPSVIITVLTVLAIGAIPTILHAVVFAYIWVRSQSLAVVTFYHAMYDGVRDGLGRIAGLPGPVGMWVNIVLAISGIILLWKGNWDYLDEIKTSPRPKG
jgi:membrane protease YdiL (CAAX protease family)